MAVESLLLEDGTKFFQREGKLTPYTTGKGKQTLYWLMDGTWAVSERTIFGKDSGEPLENVVELFKAYADKRYTSGYRFKFKYTANSLEGLRGVCLKLQADFPTLAGVSEALEMFSFEGTEKIDSSYAVTSWKGLKVTVEDTTLPEEEEELV